MSKSTTGQSSKSGRKSPRVKKRQQRTVPMGIVHVLASFNNTIVTITDPAGNVLSWTSAGKVNFKGSRKSSAYAATVAALEASRAAMGMGMKEVEVNLSGAGQGREAAVRGVQSSGLIINIIRDKTPVAHNGCRPRKRRRV